MNIVTPLLCLKIYCLEVRFLSRFLGTHPCSSIQTCILIEDDFFEVMNNISNELAFIRPWQIVNYPELRLGKLYKLIVFDICNILDVYNACNI